MTGVSRRGFLAALAAASSAFVALRSGAFEAEEEPARDLLNLRTGERISYGWTITRIPTAYGTLCLHQMPSLPVTRGLA